MSDCPRCQGRCIPDGDDAEGIALVQLKCLNCGFRSRGTLIGTQERPRGVGKYNLLRRKGHGGTA